MIPRDPLPGLDAVLANGIEILRIFRFPEEWVSRWEAEVAEVRRFLADGKLPWPPKSRDDQQLS